MLNPMEGIWSKLKSKVKQTLQVPHVMGVGIQEKRLQYLEQNIRDALTCITGGDCGRISQHVTNFYPAVLNLNDMEVGQ